MVGKWSVKNPLTLIERELIEKNLSTLSYREIAALISRDKSHVLRESKRLGDVKNYNAELAQKDFEYKQILKRKNYKKKCDI